MTITAGRALVPVAVRLFMTAPSVARCAAPVPSRRTERDGRCAKGVSEVGGQIDEGAGDCCVEDDIALAVESRTRSAGSQHASRC